ncbi:arsenate reductase family protein [Persicobacter sp. CCB-QB2]|uniref:arsenate reductase family protein n=1 Tax=Persicobacter sp. CCB-QB2 TaxID=1561025 RepID=UPI0006A948EC|nr:ArsC/Spx/MgsR family protein [Persicobacter sp. CCB-QB2]
MSRKIYHLSTCSTCKKIIAEIQPDQTFELQDIKTEKISEAQLAEMQALAGNYESLFSRRARNYAARGLKDQILTEEDYKNLILEDYTFLKRPVILFENQIFIGNSKKTVGAAIESIQNHSA